MLQYSYQEVQERPLSVPGTQCCECGALHQRRHALIILEGAREVVGGWGLTTPVGGGGGLTTGGGGGWGG